MALVNQVSLILKSFGPMRKNFASAPPPGVSTEAADDDPSAVIDAAGERKFTRNTISAFDRRHAAYGLSDRSRYRDIDPVRPDRLLRRFGKLAEIVRMMNHQTGAPAVRGVGFGDLAHDLEPGVEAEAVAAKSRRDQNSGNAGAKERVDRFPRQRARRLSRRGAVAKARGQFAHARHHRLVGVAGWRLAARCHQSPGLSFIRQLQLGSRKSFRRRFLPKHILTDKSKVAHTQFFC